MRWLLNDRATEEVKTEVQEDETEVEVVDEKYVSKSKVKAEIVPANGSPGYRPNTEVCKAEEETDLETNESL